MTSGGNWGHAVCCRRQAVRAEHGRRAPRRRTNGAKVVRQIDDTMLLPFRSLKWLADCFQLDLHKASQIISYGHSGTGMKGVRDIPRDRRRKERAAGGYPPAGGNIKICSITCWTL